MKNLAASVAKATATLAIGAAISLSGVSTFADTLVSAQPTSAQPVILTCAKFTEETDTVRTVIAAFKMSDGGLSDVILRNGDSTSDINLMSVHCAPVTGRKYDFACGEKISAVMSMTEDGEKKFVVNYVNNAGISQSLSFDADESCRIE